MQTSILRALRREAQNWWAHKDLRAAGRTDEAAQRERESITSSLRVLRQALSTKDAYVCQGRGGTTIYYANGCSVHSYGSLKHFADARIAICLGLAFIDTTSVENPVKLIRLPLVAVGREPDKPDYHSLSYAPLAVYAARAQEIGAICVNIPQTQTNTTNAQSAAENTGCNLSPPELSKKAG